MLTEIVSDEQLIKLYTEDGYLIAVDYPKSEVKLHTIDCMLADPISSIGVKPTKALENKTGEFWYSKERSEANSKAEEIAKQKGYAYIVCPICNR
ncbi:MAG: hypothetical protein CW691_04745 [Candidatus Bathyarchaeum sp.]|nr:MAG: hypothetical protein CW691_04745 [Candidatus Bathyarchaeum sp.]